MKLIISIAEWWLTKLKFWVSVSTYALLWYCNDVILCVFA